MSKKHCPQCHSMNSKYDGHLHGKQRFYCHSCRRDWVSKSKPQSKQRVLQAAYRDDGLTMANLSRTL